MRAMPSFTHRTAAPARRRLRAAATVATLALGSALAGATVDDALVAAHAAPPATAAATVDASTADGSSADAPSVALTLTVHGEERRALDAGGGARMERVRTVRFSWRSR